MSISICILKEIDGFSCEDTLRSIQQAAAKADLHCIHLETEKYFSRVCQMDVEYLSGTISEVNTETLKANFEKGIDTRQFGFTIDQPTDTSYDSVTWLVNKKNYFEAVDLMYLNRDFEFAFRFLSQYFRLKENSSDYLWVDDTDWCYSAKEMLWLSTQPYTPEWSYKKLTVH